jgi:hypothetical protein
LATSPRLTTVNQLTPEPIAAALRVICHLIGEVREIEALDRKLAGAMGSVHSIALVDNLRAPISQLAKVQVAEHLPLAPITLRWNSSKRECAATCYRADISEYKLRGAPTARIPSPNAIGPRPGSPETRADN